MDKLSKREFLKLTSLLGAGAAAPAVAAEDTTSPSINPPATDLVDENFASTSGRHFGSQIIHHGEQDGYQVTPIS